VTVEFAFTPEQEELRTTVRAMLARGAGWDRLTTELGATALAIPEEHGGFGASLVEVGIVIEEAGRALLAEPYLSTVVAAAAMPGSSWLPGIARGETVACLAVEGSCTARPDGDGYLLDGVHEHVLDGPVADVAVVAAVCDGEPGLYAVRLAEAKLTGSSTFDETRGQATISLSGTPGERVGADVGRAVDLMRAALAVESIGVARACLDLTIAHLRTREQFGVPLATFQALRHRVADLWVTTEAATSSAWYALRCAGSDEFAVAAPLAKLVAARAAYTVAAECIQLHGGIGFTWEHPAHRYFKRATANTLLFGDEPALRRLVAARAGL
jgi:alkylation response protein AidB-like acyl-CoA dehydrogenase